MNNLLRTYVNFINRYITLCAEVCTMSILQTSNCCNVCRGVHYDFARILSQMGELEKEERDNEELESEG